MKTFTISWLLVSWFTIFLLWVAPKDHVVGHNVQFRVTKEHRLLPLLPVELEVKQEEGGLADGVLTCEVDGREDDHQEGHFYIILKCNGGRVFKVATVDFTSSK